MSTIVAIDSYGGNDIRPISSYFETNVYPYLQSKGFTLSPFFGPVARLPYVGPAAADPSVTLLVGVGHGTYTSFLGFSEEAVFSIGSYAPDQVAGKIVHFLSCETARQLGPAFVADGCLAYVGYDENFTFDQDSGEIFFACDAQFVLGLADGLTVDAAVNRAKAAYSQAIADLIAQNTPKSIEVSQWLKYNLLHLRSPLDGPQWGRGDIRLT